MRGFLTRLWGANALVWVAFAALAGIVVADWSAARIPVTTALASGAFTLAGATWYCLGKRPPAALLAMAAGAFGSAHLLTVAAHRTVPLLDRIEAGERLYVEVTGVVDDIARPVGEEKSKFLVPLRLGGIREIGKDKVHPSRVRVRLVGAGLRPRYGDILQVRGYYQVPRSPRNPGEFDTRGHLRTHGMLAEIRVSDAGNVVKLGWGKGNPVVALAYRARRHVEAVLTGGLDDRPVAAATLKAMVLGDREDTPKDIEDSFRRSGTMHIFAVSGLHVGILAWLAGQALTLIGIPRRAAALTVIPLVLFYSFVTGFRPSAVRAAIMASVWFLGIALGRRPVLLNTLGAAALIILAADSFHAFHGGFQLSFLVVVFIAICARPIQKPIRRFIDPDPFLPKILLTARQKGWHATLQRFADTVSVSMAAWLGSAIPILLYFHIVTPIALLANCLLVPIAVCILGLGATSILVSVIFLGVLSAPVNRTNAYLAEATTWLATSFSKVPYGHFYIEGPSLPPEPSPKFTIFDLTTGGAARHLSLGGRNGDWLFDCGDNVAFSGTVRSGLRKRGVDRVAGLFLSHRDIDHVGGAVGLYGEIPTRGSFESVPGGGRVNRAVTEAGESKSVPVRHLNAGDTIQLTGSKAGATAEILYPPADEYARIADDRSSVIMVTCRGWRVLLIGDAGFHTEKWLLENGSKIRCDVLIKNWHGSDASGLPEFLEAANPKVIVASNGTKLVGESIPPGFKESAGALGIRVLDQAETGAVTILFGEAELELRPFLDAESTRLTLR